MHGSAVAQADRIAGRVFVASRAGQLAFSAFMIANDRRGYLAPRSQAAILVALVAESAWLAHRTVRRGRPDRPGMWVDAVASTAALLCSHHGLGPNTAPWVKNVAIGSAVGAAAGPPVDAAGVLALLCAGAAVVGTRGRGRDAHVAGHGLAVNDAISWTGMSTAARVYLGAHRRYAEDRDKADALAIERSAAAEAQRERARQHEVLHRVTIDVLRRIAAAADLREAESVAMAEAGRLRYALRTEGRLPQALDVALASAAAHAPLPVELVTAELTSEPGPRIASAVEDAVRLALDAAVDFGRAHSAVVRAVSDENTLRVSIRDHGAGVDLAAGGDYVARLDDVRAAMARVGGDVHVRSEPGRGVRVDLTVALVAGEASGEDAMQDLPHLLVRAYATGDHESPPVERGVNIRRRSGRHGSQHEVDVAVPDDLATGSAHEPLETGTQQTGLSEHLSGSRPGHSSTVADRLRWRVGDSAQFRALPAVETRRAYRTMLTAFLTWRATGLATGTAALLAGQARHRSRAVATGQLCLAVAESIWYARRAVQLSRWSDPTSGVMDAATAVTVLVLGHADLAPDDRMTWINWAPWSFATSAISAQVMADHSMRARALGVLAISAAHAVQGPRMRDAAANAVAHAGFALCARLLATQIRAGAVRLHTARQSAVAQGRALARSRERAGQLRLLHDSALQTLEAVATGRYAELSAIRVQARTEADTLDRELRGAHSSDGGLTDLLARVVATHRERGLGVVADLGPTVPVSPAVADAFAAACHEALTNVAKHSGTGCARVRLRGDELGLTLTVADDGAGFDAASPGRGFGMAQSIEARVADVGGLAAVTSRPGAGTEVVLRWPAG